MTGEPWKEGRECRRQVGWEGPGSRCGEARAEGGGPQGSPGKGWSWREAGTRSSCVISSQHHSLTAIATETNTSSATMGNTDRQSLHNNLPDASIGTGGEAGGGQSSLTGDGACGTQAAERKGKGDQAFEACSVSSLTLFLFLPGLCSWAVGGGGGTCGLLGRTHRLWGLWAFVAEFF